MKFEELEISFYLGFSPSGFDKKSQSTSTGMVNP